MKTFRTFPATGRMAQLYSMMVRGGHLGVSYNKNSVTAKKRRKAIPVSGSPSLKAKLATLTGTCQIWA